MEMALLEAQVGQKLLTWITLIMICYIVPWRPSWLSDQIAFSNSESDVVWRVSRLPPWPPSWLLELNDLAILNLHVGRRYGWRISWKPSWPPWNKMILAILNFHNTPIPPIKLKLNQTYCLGADVIWRFSRWRRWLPFWTAKRIGFSNSESLCHSDAPHQVSAQSDLRFGRGCHLKNFKMATIAAILDIRMEWFLQFWISMSHQCLPLSSAQSDLQFWRIVWLCWGFMAQSTQLGHIQCSQST